MSTDSGQASDLPLNAAARTARTDAHTGREAGVREWPEAWLVAAVRREPPDEAALDVLVGRHWAGLYARCHVLTVNAQTANDLAQETWYRMLRARQRLDPDGNFPAYLATIATNLWRDWTRSARRAGPMADTRLTSLDAGVDGAEGETLALADVIPDPARLEPEAQAMMRIDVDRALARLGPRLRDVLVARFIDGESSAEIGQRYGRTEQTITTWLRQAVREMRAHLGEARRGDVPGYGQQ